MTTAVSPHADDLVAWARERADAIERRVARASRAAGRVPFGPVLVCLSIVTGLVAGALGSAPLLRGALVTLAAILVLEGPFARAGRGRIGRHVPSPREDLERAA